MSSLYISWEIEWWGVGRCNSSCPTPFLHQAKDILLLGYFLHVVGHKGIGNRALLELWLLDGCAYSCDHWLCVQSPEV
jgi:hypothetical protein